MAKLTTATNPLPPPAKSTSVEDALNGLPTPPSALLRLLNIIFVAAGIWGSFFYWGLLQERIATRPYTSVVRNAQTGEELSSENQYFRFKFFISFVGGLWSVAISAALLLLRLIFLRQGPVLKGLPWRSVAACGFTAAFGAPFGYAAMDYVPFPVVLVLKMVKMVPVVAVGTIFHGTRYSWMKYLCALLITSGVVGFQYKSGGAEDASLAGLLGIVLCFINLTFDGYTNSTQDVIFKKVPDLPSLQMMFMCNVGSTFFVALSLLSTIYLSVPVFGIFIPGELQQATKMFLANDELRADLTLFGILGAAGQCCIFAAISLIGSLSVVGLTVSRKVLSVFGSVILHEHQLSTRQWLSLAVVAIGVVIDTVENVRHPKNKKKTKA